MFGIQGSGAKKDSRHLKAQTMVSFAQGRRADLGTEALTLHVTGLSKLSPRGSMPEHAGTFAPLRCLVFVGQDTARTDTHRFLAPLRPDPRTDARTNTSKN